MIILLPKNFEFADDNGKGFAYSEYNKLFMSRSYIHFEDLMYAITYDLKDSSYCIYCKGVLYKSNRTLDHMNPRDLGGPTIPNNLCHCCKNCNSEKNNMNTTQYKKFRLISNKTKQKAYREIVKNQIEIQKYDTGFNLPKRWVSIEETSKIFPRYIPHNYKITSKYKKTKTFHNTYNNLPRPVIVDKNKIILDGLNIWLLAQDLKIKRIPVIVLENVVIRK